MKRAKGFIDVVTTWDFDFEIEDGLTEEQVERLALIEYEEGRLISTSDAPSVEITEIRELGRGG